MNITTLHKQRADIIAAKLAKHLALTTKMTKLQKQYDAATTKANKAIKKIDNILHKNFKELGFSSALEARVAFNQLDEEVSNG